MKRLLLLLFLCSAAMCGSPNSETYTVEETGDVRHIHNHAPLWGDTPEVTVEFVRQIGGLESENENYQFYQPMYTACDSENSLYVADRGNYRIQKFDRDRQYELTIGRQGEGPGEFQGPSGIQVNANGDIYIMDAPAGLMHVFRQDGSFVKSFRLTGLSERFLLLLNGNIVMRYGKGMTGSEQDQSHAQADAVLCVMNTEGDVLSSFGDPLILEDTKLLPAANAVFCARDNEDNIFVTFKSQNRIEKYSPDGRLIWTCDRPFADEIRYYMREVTLEEGYRLNAPMGTFVSKAIGIDHRGRLWALTYAEQPYIPAREDKDMVKQPDKLRFEVFSMDGILLGYVPIETYSYSIQIHGDGIFITSSRDHAVFEYRIVDVPGIYCAINH